MYPTPYDDLESTPDLYPIDYAKKHYSRAVEPLLLKQDGRYEILEIKGGIGAQEATVKVRSKRDVYDERPLSEIPEKDLRIRDIRYHRFTVQEVLNAKLPNGAASLPVSPEQAFSMLRSSGINLITEENQIIVGEHSVTIKCTDPNSLFWTGEGVLVASAGAAPGGSLWSTLYNYAETPPGAITITQDLPAIGFLGAMATTRPLTNGLKFDLTNLIPLAGLNFGQTIYILVHRSDHDTAVNKFIGLITNTDPDYAFFLGISYMEITGVISGSTRRVRFADINQGAMFLANFNDPNQAKPATLYLNVSGGKMHYRTTMVESGNEVTLQELDSGPISGGNGFTVTVLSPVVAPPLLPLFISAI